MNVIIRNLLFSVLFVLKRSLDARKAGLLCLSGWRVGGGRLHPWIVLCHTLKHITPPPLPPSFPSTTHPRYQPAEGRAGACVQMNQCCLLYCFRLELFQVAYLREPQIMCSKLTLIISDPGERRALSLHTIKAMELAWRTCFSVNRGSQSTYKK